MPLASADLRDGSDVAPPGDTPLDGDLRAGPLDGALRAAGGIVAGPPLLIPAFADGACDTPAPLPPPYPEPLASDGWYPEIDLTRLRAEARIRDTVTPERCRDAVVSALVWVADQLAAWQLEQLDAGYATLADVPAATILGESRLVLLYRQAVAGWAKALLVERYRDTDLTGRGDRRIEDVEPAVGEHRRDAIHAIRALLGRPRTDVALL